MINLLKGVASIVGGGQSNDKAEKPQKVDTPHPLAVRMDAFCAKIRARFDESLPQGEEAVLASLDDNDYDIYASLRTLSSIVSTVSETLVKRAGRVWQDEVRPQLLEEDENNLDIKIAHQVSDQETGMRHELEIWKTQTAGKLSQKYYDYALTLVNKDFFCTQCKSPLAIKEKAFHSQYVTCAYCKTVNTFIPESKFCQAGWAVVDDLATYRVFDLFKEFRRWHNLPRRRDEAEAAAQREGTMKATLVFVQAMLKERIELMPEAAENYDFDLKTKMRQIGFNENEYSI